MARPGAGTARPWLALGLVVLLAAGATEAWHAHLARQLGLALAQQARPGDIRMLSSLTCVFCARARQWLTVQQVPFTECFIERDADCAATYRALGAPGTPTLLVRGQAQLGFSPQRVRDRLADTAAAGG